MITQGNRLSCRDQEGRRGSEEAVPGPSLFLSGEPGVSGDFWGSQEGCQGPSRPSAQVQSLGWEHSLEKGMATHSSILAWKIPWREEPGMLQSMAGGFGSLHTPGP